MHVWRPQANKYTANQHKCIRVTTLSLIIWVYLHLFSCCWSRSSKVIVNQKRTCDILVINSNFGHNSYIFEILTFKARKWLLTPLIWRPRLGEPVEFLDETYPTDTLGMGIPYGENFIILTSTIFGWSNRVTDGRTGDSICAICCRALKTSAHVINLW